MKEYVSRNQALKIHKILTRRGHFDAARKILKMLIDGSVKLGLGDSDWLAERAIEIIGGRPWYTDEKGIVTYRVEKSQSSKECIGGVVIL